MHCSLSSRRLAVRFVAATVVAFGCGLPAVAGEPRHLDPPQTFPFALLSDTGADGTYNSDPSVMGEVEMVRERYPDGAIKIERQMTLDRDGNYVNHGGWKMFGANGDVLAEGQYHFGQRVGVWTRWHAKNDSHILNEYPFNQFKAPFMSQASFTNGVMDGDWLIVDANDKKCSQVSLKNGQRHGMAITWLPNGTTFRQATFENGQPVGELLEIDKKSNKLEKVATYVDGRKIINKTNYYPGTKQKKNEVMYLGATTIEQTADEFWSLKFAKYGTNGKDLKHGVSKAWYSTGKVEQEGTYQYGQKSGTFTFWHENGQIATTGEYRQDLPEGQWVWWHQNGQKSAIGNYRDGQLIGEWRWWSESGKLTKSHTYDGTESAAAEPEGAFDVSSRPATSHTKTK